MKIIWCMVADMECNRQNFLSFWTTFCPLTLLTTRKIKILKKLKTFLVTLSFRMCVPEMKIIWCIVPDIWSATFFLAFSLFFSFYHLKKRKEINLNKCIINDNHMRYGYWDMKHSRHNFLSLWAIFGPFTPLTTQKIKTLKIWRKKHGDINILHKCT